MRGPVSVVRRPSSVGQAGGYSFRALTAALIVVTSLAIPAVPNSRQRTTDDGRRTPEFALVSKLAAELAAGREAAARSGAAADPSLSRAAFEELMADAVGVRLHGSEPAVADEDRLLALLAEASGPQAVATLDRLAGVAKGANPFEGSADAFERLLGALCAVDQVANPDDLAGGVEQEKRARAALDLARAADNLVATYSTLGLLGLFAFQGGDMGSAESRWAEAAEAASRAGHDASQIQFRRLLAVAYAQERKLVEARREAAATEALLSGVAAPSPKLQDVGASLYAELVSYNEQLGDRDGAIEVLKRQAAFLGRTGAPADRRADVHERLARFYAQNAVASRLDAEEGARALTAAGDAWLEIDKRDRAMLALTGAGVLLVENVGGREARPLFERARTLAESLGESAVVGLIYWLGRSHLAEGTNASVARASALFDVAAARTERLARGKNAADFADLRATIAFWSGRAHLARGPKDPPLAGQFFKRAFDMALAAGDVNKAVLYAEWYVRAAGAGPAATQAATRIFDALVATKRLDPVRTAEALVVVLEEGAPRQPHALDPASVALFDRASASISLVRTAAEAGDGTLLAARADKVFDTLATAQDASGRASAEAQDLAERVAEAWGYLGNSSEAARWRAKLRPLAEATYKSGLEAKLFEAAAVAAERLTRAAIADKRVEDAATWARAAAEARGRVVEGYEEKGKLGLAAENARRAASVLLDASQYVPAREWFDRAAKLSASAGDREARAEALARRARAELSAGDAKSALASAHEALGLASANGLAGNDLRTYTLPTLGDVLFVRSAFDALRVRGDAYAVLADSEQDATARAAHGEQAIASYVLAVGVRERTRAVTRTEGEKPLVTRVGDAAVFETLVMRLIAAGRTTEAFGYAVRAFTEAYFDRIVPEAGDHSSDWDKGARFNLRTEVHVKSALLREELARMTTDVDRRRVAALEKEVEAAKARFEASISGLTDNSPWMRDYFMPWGYQPDSLIQALGSDAAVIYYFPIGDRTVVFVVARGQVVVRELVAGRSDVELLMKEARAVAAGTSGRGAEREIYRRLYESLLAPIQGDLAGVRIVGVMDNTVFVQEGAELVRIDKMKQDTPLDKLTFTFGGWIWRSRPLREVGRSGEP
jgi:hypothetical protein